MTGFNQAPTDQSIDQTAAASNKPDMTAAKLLAATGDVVSIPTSIPDVPQGLGFPAVKNLFGPADLATSRSTESQVMSSTSFAAAAAARRPIRGDEDDDIGAIGPRVPRGDDEDDDIGAIGPRGDDDEDDDIGAIGPHGEDDEDGGDEDNEPDDGGGGGNNWIANLLSQFRGLGLLGGLFGLFSGKRGLRSGGGCNGGDCSSRMSYRNRVDGLSSQSASSVPGITLWRPGFGPFGGNKSS